MAKILSICILFYFSPVCGTVAILTCQVETSQSIATQMVKPISIKYPN